MPEGVARTGARGAHVRVAVVAVDPPGVQDALQIDELVARAPEVVHDLRAPALDERLPDPGAQVVEHLVPAHALPLPAAPGPDAAQRVPDPLGIVHLVECRGPLCAVASAALNQVNDPERIR